jgi:hypothetical protein
VSDDSKKTAKRKSPLSESALFSSEVGPVQSLPPLPTLAQQETLAPPQAQQGTPVQEGEPLLYLSEPSAEYLLRPFDRQRDKGAINGNPYLLGAVEAIGKLRKMDKYEVYDEMCQAYIEKYRDILEHRPDVVRACEARYRLKHHL